MANPEGGGHGVQLPLRAEGIQEIFVFYSGAYPIYPKEGYKGAPTQDFKAIRIEGKIAGLNAYESITPSIYFIVTDKEKIIFGQEVSVQNLVHTHARQIRRQYNLI